MRFRQTHRWLGAACLLGGLAMTWTAAPAAAEEGLRFRDLVRKYAEDKDGSLLAKQMGFSDSVKHVVALEYTILLKRGEGEKAVDPASHQFELGDEIRVQIQPIDDAYIYIFTEGASGQRQCLLPKTDRGEKAPLVKAGSRVELPDDGSAFQFAPPPGTEQLLVVATEKPAADLAGLANVVFAKPDDVLSEKEKEIKKTLRAKASAKLESIRKRQSGSITYRGLLSDKAMAKLADEVRRQGPTRSVLEEPPTGQAQGTFAMVASTEEDDSPSLLVSISLKSVASKPERP